MLRIASLATLAVYWAAIFIGTHLPADIQVLGPIYDKLLHFAAYAGLTFLLAAALAAMRRRLGRPLLPWGIAAVYGCVDELSQMAIPGRHAGVGDWVADVLGAGVGVFAFGVLSLAIVKFFARPATAECEAAVESAA